MSAEKLYNELINSMIRGGGISSAGYNILLEKGKELGFNKETVDILIELEKKKLSGNDYEDSEDFDEYSLDTEREETFKSYKDNSKSRNRKKSDNTVYEFKSAITRLGPILTPHVIKIHSDKIEYRKRNKHLFNVDSIVIPIDKIASIKVDSHIWGADIIIKSYGAGEIVGKCFTVSDAKQIQRLIQERQG
ncbi:MAG: hypothetical protein KGZ97_04515 [Bacteroidetes bacterium]|nr:hypothetical protein [Bacteroidota bacterium]